jgi:hypothetical protein
MIEGMLTVISGSKVIFDDNEKFKGICSCTGTGHFSPQMLPSGETAELPRLPRLPPLTG